MINKALAIRRPAAFCGTISRTSKVEKLRQFQVLEPLFLGYACPSTEHQTLLQAVSFLTSSDFSLNKLRAEFPIGVYFEQSLCKLSRICRLNPLTIAYNRTIYTELFAVSHISAASFNPWHDLQRTRTT